MCLYKIKAKRCNIIRNSRLHLLSIFYIHKILLYKQTPLQNNHVLFIVLYSLNSSGWHRRPIPPTPHPVTIIGIYVVFRFVYAVVCAWKSSSCLQRLLGLRVGAQSGYLKPCFTDSTISRFSCLASRRSCSSQQWTCHCLSAPEMNLKQSERCSQIHWG